MAEERLSCEELMQRLDSCPATGTRWRHIKTGSSYTVTSAAICESTLEPLVIYGTCYGPLFARPLSDFLSKFEAEKMSESQAARLARVEEIKKRDKGT